MNLSSRDLQHFVIVPTLEYLSMHSQAAEKQLLATASQESGLDPFAQFKQGGIGIYQITSEQHRSVWDTFLAFDPDLASQVRGLASQHLFLKSPDDELRTNLAYSTAIAWMLHLQSAPQQSVANDDTGLDPLCQNDFPSTNQHPGNLAMWIREHSNTAI
jgi:hypothetical protein